MTLNISRVSGTVGHRGKEKISMTRRRRKKKRKRRKKVCRWAMGVLPRQRGEDSALLLKSGTWHDSQNSRKEKEGDRTRRRKRGEKRTGERGRRLELEEKLWHDRLHKDLLHSDAGADTAQEDLWQDERCLRTLRRRAGVVWITPH